MNNNDKFHGTTIVGVRRGKEVVVGGDGQVTLGNTVMKNNAKKVRRLYKDNVIANLYHFFANNLKNHKCGYGS